MDKIKFIWKYLTDKDFMMGLGIGGTAGWLTDPYIPDVVDVLIMIMGLFT